ncbi:MAG: DUF998 domain-containing protein [Ardenticatenaceae bacterium]|nr:DUF998 domain-containing protein [Ardenticatenaceae bacterium]MCB9444542.1 DUF998 domain-containing protein [Ardenticatenaceae bacterium]
MGKWRKQIAALALGLAFVFPVVILVAGALQPNYSPVFDAVSALGTPDAVLPGLINYAGFGLAGVLMLVFVTAVYPVFRGDVLGVATAVLLTLTGISLIGVGLFHCDPGCPIAGASPMGMTHNLFGVALLLFAALTPWITAVYQKQVVGGRFVWLSLVIGAALLGLLVLLPAALWVGWAGLQERLFLLVYLVWLVMFGRSIARQLY